MISIRSNSAEGDGDDVYFRAEDVIAVRRDSYVRSCPSVAVHLRNGLTFYTSGDVRDVVRRIEDARKSTCPYEEVAT